MIYVQLWNEIDGGEYVNEIDGGNSYNENSVLDRLEGRQFSADARYNAFPVANLGLPE